MACSFERTVDWLPLVIQYEGFGQISARDFIRSISQRKINLLWDSQELAAVPIDLRGSGKEIPISLQLMQQVPINIIT